MQENRSFDHYFGTFPGARGFNDPTAIRLPTGRPVFQQPDPANPDGYLEPWHMSTITTGAAAVPSLSHDWRDQHASWNQGAMDGWLLTHVASDGDTNGSFTMGYYEEEDIPFHWALAKAFTLAGQLPLLGHGPHGPQPALLGDGHQRPAGKGGRAGAGDRRRARPDLRDLVRDALQGRVQRQVVPRQRLDRPHRRQLLQAVPDPPGSCPTALYNAINSVSTLFGDGTPGGIGDPANPTPASNPQLAFEEDCANGTLADVSFIGTGESEHPPAIPAAGAQFLASKLEALAANEDLWNSTVFVLNYDENDGFFDHVVPPTPNPNEFPEEFVTLASPAGTPGGGLPSAPGSGFPASSSRPGRWAAGSSPRSPTTPPACGSSRRWRRPAACPARARLPSPASAAGGGRLQRLHRGPAPGHAAARALEHPVRPPPPRRPTWPPSRRPPSSRCRRAPARPSSSR